MFLFVKNNFKLCLQGKLCQVNVFIINYSISNYIELDYVVNLFQK